MGGSDLAISILGPWARAPRAARDAYERYVAAVSSLLGGEASSEEVHEAGRVVWSTLADAPPRGPTQGRGSAAAVKQIGSVPFFPSLRRKRIRSFPAPAIALSVAAGPTTSVPIKAPRQLEQASLPDVRRWLFCRETLAAALGPLDEASLQPVLSAFDALRSWQRQLKVATAPEAKHGDVGASSTQNGHANGAHPARSAGEFGADLIIHTSRLAGDPDAAVLAMCGVSPGSPTAADRCSQLRPRSVWCFAAHRARALSDHVQCSAVDVGEHSCASGSVCTSLWRVLYPLRLACPMSANGTACRVPFGLPHHD